MLEGKGLYRNKTKGYLGGVCAGIADYFNVEAIYVMFAFVALTLFGFFFVPIIYLILWLVLPLHNDENEPLGERVKENWAEIKSTLRKYYKQVKNQISGLGLTN